ncbi:class F sortase [Embleya sp. NBC_00896]|uniref:class F sortase n=1 Tax=Embleya sp. NBC_00896 TaxID=2975961 RepID=UPI002F906EF4|nr:class F sortase [Embleya sp. NBC_00896]
MTEPEPEPAEPSGAADRPHRGRGRRLSWAAAIAVPAVCGMVLVYAAYSGVRPPPSPPRGAAVPIAPIVPPVPPVPETGPAGSTPAAAPSTAPMRASTPTRIRVPSLAISAPLIQVGLTEGGGIEVPAEGERNLAGWYRGGVTPGQRGTASIVGHVDTADGPAVFYPLGALSPGERIEIDRADGSVASFVVDGVEAFDKDDFPVARVFADAERPELRLITCGGSYSKKSHYSGNVVAFAHLAP